MATLATLTGHGERSPDRLPLPTTLCVSPSRLEYDTWHKAMGRLFPQAAHESIGDAIPGLRLDVVWLHPDCEGVILNDTRIYSNARDWVPRLLMRLQERAEVNFLTLKMDDAESFLVSVVEKVEAV